MHWTLKVFWGDLTQAQHAACIGEYLHNFKYLKCFDIFGEGSLDVHGKLGNPVNCKNSNNNYLILEIIVWAFEE